MAITGHFMHVLVLGELIFVNGTIAMNVRNKKFENLDAMIDRYVELCVKIEKQTGCKLDFTFVRRLAFTQSCVIRCYNAMIERKSIMPLRDLWNAYKVGTVACSGKQFMYELCNLIGLVFEQFIMKLITNVAGQDVNSINALLAKIDSNIPLDELIDILEQCYNILMNAIHVEHADHVPVFLKKRWVVLVLTGMLALYKLYSQFCKNGAPAVVVH